MYTPETDRDPATLTQEEINAIYRDIYQYDGGDPLAVERLKGHLTACGFSYEHNEHAIGVGGWIVALWYNYF